MEEETNKMEVEAQSLSAQESEDNQVEVDAMQDEEQMTIDQNREENEAMAEMEPAESVAAPSQSQTFSSPFQHLLQHPVSAQQQQWKPEGHPQMSEQSTHELQAQAQLNEAQLEEMRDDSALPNTSSNAERENTEQQEQSQQSLPIIQEQMQQLQYAHMAQLQENPAGIPNQPMYPSMQQVDPTRSFSYPSSVPTSYTTGNSQHPQTYHFIQPNAGYQDERMNANQFQTLPTEFAPRGHQQDTMHALPGNSFVPNPNELQSTEMQQRIHVLDSMNKIQQEFTDVKEEIYQSQLGELKKDYQSIRSGTSDKYVQGCSSLEQQLDHKKWKAEMWKNYQIMAIENLYYAECKQAEDELEYDKKQLKNKMLNNVQAKMALLEEERNTLSLPDASNESRSSARLRKRNKDTGKDRRLQPSHTNYILRDSEIYEDLNNMSKYHPADPDFDLRKWMDLAPFQI